MAKNTKKNSQGRPSKYDSSYCEELIEHMSVGKSLESFAGKIRIARSTLYKWLEENEDFKEAYEIAKMACLDFYETHGINLMTGLSRGNSAVYKFQLVNRFHDLYKLNPDQYELIEKQKELENLEEKTSIDINIKYDPLRNKKKSK